MHIPVSSFKKVFEYIKALRQNRRLGIFLIFLVLSAIFWFLTQLEEVYVTSISYPVEYRDMPEDKIVVGNLPSHMDLEIKGAGFKLLEYKFSNELNPLVLHVNAYNLQTTGNGDKPRYYIVTQSTATRISQQLSQEVEILDITPDTLFFEFADKITKRVPVKPNVQIEFAKQMMLQDDILIEPDTVDISGPSSVLDTVSEVQTKKKKFTELQENVQTQVGLERIHDQVEFSFRKVQLTIPVEQYTEGKLEKTITIENMPDSVILRAFPQTVTITYLVGLSKYEKVIPELFKASVDYKQVKEGEETLKVRIDKAPDYLKSYSFSPREVEYLIERKP